MVSLAVLATTLWLCPGNVYSNEPKPGCKPFHESNKEGFSTVPEPRFDSPSPGASPAPAQPPDARSPSKVPSQSTNAEVCSLYAEYVELTLRVTGGHMGNSPEDVNRYEQLRNLFGINARPNCP